MSIALVTIGPVDETALLVIAESLRDSFGVPVTREKSLVVPSGAFDPARNQYSAPTFLRDMLRQIPDTGERLLGVTECDLFIPMLSFLFGQAQLEGRSAVVSLARLHQGFYGLSEDPALTRKRGAIEAIHEIGHTFGLIHCMIRSCPMSLATTIQHLDLKGAALCSGCARLALDSPSLKSLKART